ncbi:unnamed protein product [Gadus morhua 'NCC']
MSKLEQHQESDEVMLSPTQPSHSARLSLGSTVSREDLPYRRPGRPSGDQQGRGDLAGATAEQKLVMSFVRLTEGGETPSHRSDDWEAPPAVSLMPDGAL